MQIFEELVTRWIEEFGRAVEMFTGEKPTLTRFVQEKDLDAGSISANTWWEQVTEGDGSFTVWAGATESLWNALGEGAEAQSSFFEMLSQANQGTAAVFSAGFPKPLRCLDGESKAPVLPLNVATEQIKVVFRGADAGVISFVVEKKAFAILSPEEPESEKEKSAASPPLGVTPAMLARLLDLQLPVSVLLGRAPITVKEALKLMSGSVIELDRHVGDHVEIMVHGTVVATGEIVSVKGNYGVRIKEVISRQDRLALHHAA